MDKGKLGRDCREILRHITEKGLICAASLLVVDEVLWVLKKKLGKPDAIKITKAMLSLPLKWIELDKSIILKMIDSYERSTLDPRDAIHVSSMKERGLSVIVSEDSDFDGIHGIERIDASNCIARFS